MQRVGVRVRCVTQSIELKPIEKVVYRRYVSWYQMCEYISGLNSSLSSQEHPSPPRRLGGYLWSCAYLTGPAIALPKPGVVMRGSTTRKRALPRAKHPTPSTVLPTNSALSTTLCLRSTLRVLWPVIKCLGNKKARCRLLRGTGSGLMAAGLTPRSLADLVGALHYIYCLQSRCPLFSFLFLTVLIPPYTQFLPQCLSNRFTQTWTSSNPTCSTSSSPPTPH